MAPFAKAYQYDVPGVESFAAAMGREGCSMRVRSSRQRLASMLRREGIA